MCQVQINSLCWPLRSPQMAEGKAVAPVDAGLVTVSMSVQAPGNIGKVHVYIRMHA